MADITAQQPESPYTVAQTIPLTAGSCELTLYDYRGWLIIDGEVAIFSSNKPNGITDPPQPVPVQLQRIGQTHPQGMQSRGVQCDRATGFCWELFTSDDL